MNIPAINVKNHSIGEGFPPFIIAEMSGNHNQSLERALALVDEAAKCGCHALKIQTYTADTMTLESNDTQFSIADENSLWKGRTLYSLYQEAATPWEWHKAIFDRCAQHGILGFSTPFDETAVDFLESLNVPLYKIASFENTHLPLVKKVAQTGKPLIISTGMASVAELQELVETVRSTGNSQCILLKCTSAYPATAKEANLATIPHLREMFGVHVGLSDHTLGVGVALASVMLGACVIEKHFTLRRSDGGPDAAFSLEPSEFRVLVEESKSAWESRGKVSYGPTEVEKKSLMFRRSLYAVKDIAEGEEFTSENIKAIRPGYGLPPKHLEELLGKRARVAISRGKPLQWRLIEEEN